MVAVDDRIQSKVTVLSQAVAVELVACLPQPKRSALGKSIAVSLGLQGLVALVRRKARTEMPHQSTHPA